jgi:hypothetical protein
MKNITPRIQKAIDIFLDAINNGTLAKGDCAACAVGNLVGAGLGSKITSKTVFSNHFQTNKLVFEASPSNTGWSHAFATNVLGEQKVDYKYFEHIDVLEAVEATDFSLEELIQIEAVFENKTLIYASSYLNHTDGEIRKDQIRGLTAVVKLMMTFDEVTEDVEKVFTEKAQLIPVNNEDLANN